jgi:hypothetical protein
MLKSKKLISIIAIASLVLSTSLSSSVKAASIVAASDRLSDSDLSVTATHNITFTPNLTLALNEYFEVNLPSAFGTIAGSGNLTCPGSLTASVIGAPSRQARCTASSGTYNAATTTMTITGVTNPVSAGSYSISISSFTSGGVVKEGINVVVAIISSVSVSANVPSSLTFAIVPLATSTVVNGATTTAASATTSIGFGNLQVGTSSIMGQQLQVTTNANYGFKVTVEQDQNLTSNSGSTIDAFQLGTPPGTPIAWTSPTGVLDSLNTYGHMGFTTDDTSLSGGNPYGSGMWMGFTGATTQEIMYHNGPADGSTQSKGMAKVAYRVQITALQEAGDYANTLTYVATPTY